MLILSIDVGIKNLAFCLGNINFDSSLNYINTNILDWKIIDLVETITCQEIKSCKCNAKFYLTNTDPYNNKEKLFYICNKHSNKYDKNKLNKFKNDNSNAISIINLSQKIIKSLDKYFLELFENEKIELKNIDFIIIENQIGPLANRMKSIQALLTMYFMANNNFNINYISSINKLKYFTNQKTNYKERKKKSIEITNNILQDNLLEIYKPQNKGLNNIENILFPSIKIIDNKQKWINEFKNKYKKDDLADCLLQLLYFYIEKKNF